jgi:hemolysin activation/secretion protein
MVSAGLSVIAVQVAAQTALHLISPNPVESTVALPDSHPGAVAPSGPAAPAAVAANVSIVLRAVRIEGARAIAPASLAPLWQGLVGKRVTGADLAALSRRIADRYSAAGYALINVQVPPQDFAGGVVRMVVQEGHVENVRIEGNTDGADLTLLKHYAARIIADRPLRRSTLERYILLMNDIPGLKVGSRFEPVPGHPGVAALRLAILRKRVEAGIAVNNQGNGQLGTTQATVNLVANNLLREGERTQIVFGAPVTIRRYQYYGFSHVEPLGYDGATVTFGYGRLVTQPQSNAAAGSADTFIIRLSYPVIRALRETLVLNADLNALNSNAAYLGQALSDERTRSLRLGAIYGRQDDWGGTTVLSGTFSHGFATLGARRGSVAFGGPDYAKFYGAIAREQKLPLDLTLRARVMGQYATHHLPSTEQFLFGGPQMGKAFNYAYMAGDRGLAGYVELAHPWPGFMTPKLLGGSEIFAYTDWGEVSTIDTRYQLRYARAASAGGGIRVKLLHRFTLELGAAWVLNHSRGLAHSSSPRVMFNIGGSF